MSNFWTKEEQELLKKSLGKMTYKEMSETVLTSKTERACQAKASRLGLTSKETKHKCWRKFNFNEEYFKNLDKKSAYSLGFFMADGNLYKRNNSYSIRFYQKTSDKYILENIAKTIEYSGVVFDRKDKNLSELTLHSKKMYLDLLALGMTPAKSLTVFFPKIKEELYSEYIRGVLDGDGCLRIKEDRTIGVQFVGSIAHYEEMSKFLNKKLGIKRKKVYQKQKYGILEYYNKDAIILLNWIYQEVNMKNTKLFLKRKYQKYKDAKELYNNWHLRNRGDGTLGSTGK